MRLSSSSSFFRAVLVSGTHHHQQQSKTKMFVIMLFLLVSILPIVDLLKTSSSAPSTVVTEGNDLTTPTPSSPVNHSISSSTISSAPLTAAQPSNPSVNETVATTTIHPNATSTSDASETVSDTTIPAVVTDTTTIASEPTVNETVTTQSVAPTHQSSSTTTTTAAPSTQKPRANQGKCDPIVLPNGSIIPSSASKKPQVPGTSVILKCNMNLKLTPNYSILRCTSKGQWDQPLPKCQPLVAECRSNTTGVDYHGYRMRTEETFSTCLRWDELPKNISYAATRFPESNVTLAENYCRNPDPKNFPHGPWCYTAGYEIEYCGIPYCEPSEECLVNEDGVGYRGTRSYTKSGIKCQRWSQQTPQKHGYTKDYLFPDLTIWDAADYCRNPVPHLEQAGKTHHAPWCFTMDSNHRMEECDIPRCKKIGGEHCVKTKRGIEYRGHEHFTMGRQYECQRWDSQFPHKHNFTHASMFADSTVSEAQNYCRNPDHQEAGPWCFTTDPRKRFAFCQIPFCPSKVPKNWTDTFSRCSTWVGAYMIGSKSKHFVFTVKNVNKPSSVYGVWNDGENTIYLMGRIGNNGKLIFTIQGGKNKMQEKYFKVGWSVHGNLVKDGYYSNVWEYQGIVKSDIPGFSHLTLSQNCSSDDLSASTAMQRRTLMISIGILVPVVIISSIGSLLYWFKKNDWFPFRARTQGRRYTSFQNPLYAS
ncbi:uncharacterized protein LOC141911006 [Tubulanus polymorphus]|uniref:uncharacterized protein LOC141911006 n=1 Tax=Tubulanus polymorphus TaxID=672921 RepID=UPI003DA578A5